MSHAPKLHLTEIKTASPVSQTHTHIPFPSYWRDESAPLKAHACILGITKGRHKGEYKDGYPLVLLGFPAIPERIRPREVKARGSRVSQSVHVTWSGQPGRRCLRRLDLLPNVMYGKQFAQWWGAWGFRRRRRRNGRKWRITGVKRKSRRERWGRGLEENNDEKWEKREKGELYGVASKLFRTMRGKRRQRRRTGTKIKW